MAINQEPTSTTHNGRIRLTSGLLYIAQISGIITVIAATIYILGLVAVLLPILNKYDVAFENAWYMVSLMPKTVIAGHGVRSLVWPALFTVIPIAFIVVMILILMAILFVGVRRAKHQVNIVKKSELYRGVPFITAVYLAYSAVLVVVLLAIYSLVKFANFSVSNAFLQYHVVAGALAYGVFALLCLLTLCLLTWRAGRYVTRLIRTREVSYQSLKEFGSRKVQLRLTLYIGMVCVVCSSIFLADLFSEDGFSALPVFLAWIVVLVSLIVLGPVMLMLLLLDRVFSSELLDKLGATLATVGVALKRLLSMVGPGAALASILLFFAALVVAILQRKSPPLLEGLLLGAIDALLLLLLLFVMVLLLSLVGKAIPLEALKGAGATLRFVFIAVAVVCTALLFWGLITLLHAPVQEDLSQDRSPLATVMPLVLGLLSFVVLGAIALSLLVLQGVRYIARTVVKTTTVASTPSKDFRRHPAKRVESLRAKIRQLQSSIGDELFSVVRYAGVLFGAFYITLLITFLYGNYLIWPLIDNINSISRSESILDELFFYLILVGGIVSGALLYKGLFRTKEGATEEDLLSAENWQSFLKCLWKTTRPRPTWKWVAWSLTGAYVFSVIVGSLIAYLEEPPLPQVELVQGGKSVQPWESVSTEEPGFQSTSHSLLAHADGYWYLLDEDDGELVAILDQSSYMVKTPKHVEVVDETGALKVEVPSEWREDLSDYPLAWDKDPASVETSRLTVSTNVYNLGRGYTTPGVFTEVYSAEKWAQRWDKPVSDDTVYEYSIDSQEVHREYCGPPDEGPAVYDLEDEERRYAARIIRWRACEGGGYLAKLVALPKDHSFVLLASVQLPKDKGTAYDAETDRILRSIEVRSDLLP
jgi:hypothetical protein